MKRLLSFLRRRPRRVASSGFCRVRTELQDVILLHAGDIIHFEPASKNGFRVDAAVLRDGQLQNQPIALCDRLRDAYNLKTDLEAALNRGDARFDARRSARVLAEWDFKAVKA